MRRRRCLFMYIFWDGMQWRTFYCVSCHTFYYHICRILFADIHSRRLGVDATEQLFGFAIAWQPRRRKVPPFSASFAYIVRPRCRIWFPPLINYFSPACHAKTPFIIFHFIYPSLPFSPNNNNTLREYHDLKVTACVNLSSYFILLLLVYYCLVVYIFLFDIW